ncbi:hypothetical protein [Pseudomonas sp. NPDC087615]|uniref:hypothetical protein n=1 Tax=Pseudomonas sp. NPDC087615 TaxID=3364443 RepID=UPI00380383BE
MAFLGQAIDAYDTIESSIVLYNAESTDGKEDAQFDLLMAVIGWIPGPGDGLKKSLRIVKVTASTVTKQWEAAVYRLGQPRTIKLSSPEGVLHTAATAMHCANNDVRAANDGTYAIDYSQVTKPESLILQRRQTITAPLQQPKADKASALVGIRTASRRNRPAL